MFAGFRARPARRCGRDAGVLLGERRRQPSDVPPDWPDVLTGAIGDEINSPVEWAQKCAQEYGVDLISLKLLGADPAGKDVDATACAKVVQDVLKAVDLPLVIWGCGDDEKDSTVLPECSQAARGENCLIGSAKESNYMTVVAICKADKHKIVSEAPVDINLGKQVLLKNVVIIDAWVGPSYNFRTLEVTSPDLDTGMEIFDGNGFGLRMGLAIGIAF